MDEGRARCPAVPAPVRRPVASLTGQLEAGPGAVIGAGAVGGLGQRRQCCRRAGHGAYATARSGLVKFIRQAGEVHPSGRRRRPPLSLAS
jgi:hypothetical protein